MNLDLGDEVRQLHAQVCKALADPTRILLLYFLGEGPLTVTELTMRTELSQPAISRHLAVLRERGLVIGERQGQSVKYHLADRRILGALDLMRLVMNNVLTNRAALARAPLAAVQSADKQE